MRGRGADSSHSLRDAASVAAGHLPRDADSAAAEHLTRDGDLGPRPWEAVGLTREEYGRIVELLGREPNRVELGVFGVLWSEHCSYKSSRAYLRLLPAEGERVLLGPGENAGLLDLGDGYICAVRIESHNHPSAIEPYQGAATGVGGILRDVFTLGARPVALLNSLWFGPLAPGAGEARDGEVGEAPDFVPTRDCRTHPGEPLGGEAGEARDGGAEETDEVPRGGVETGNGRAEKGQGGTVGEAPDGGAEDSAPREETRYGEAGEARDREGGAGAEEEARCREAGKAQGEAEERNAEARNRYLLEGVVRGIADYGNSVGVPTVGGEVHFDPGYASNPLVNVMCVGILEPGRRPVRGRAEGPGNPVFLVGNKTGRDGIHGASLLASQEFSASPEEMRPAVQVGDPFVEKLLLEACLELAATDALVGMNDLGAAGISSAAAETAARAGTGMEIVLDRVPLREEGMDPYEILLSESQERMLVIGRAGREEEVRRIFARWGLEAREIGRVTGDGVLRVFFRGEKVAEIPVEALTRRAPVYERPGFPPERLARCREWKLSSLPPPSPRELGEIWRRLISSPLGGSRAWVYTQYDHMVRTSTVLGPGGDAAVIRVRGTGKMLALSVDGNGRYGYLDPRAAGALAVAEGARNVSATGAEPIGVVDGLNFASPERPETVWEFRQCLEGMREACQALGLPVVGGNVSFYNETLGRGIPPTPVIGTVGLLEGREPLGIGFRRPGDAVVLLGPLCDPEDPWQGLGGSLYLAFRGVEPGGAPPRLDLRMEKAVQSLVREAAARGLLSSAHDVSEGGLALALAECTFLAREGADGLEVDLPRPEGVRLEALLFGEAPSRFVASLPPERLPLLERLCRERGVPLAVLGRVVPGEIRVAAGGEEVFSARVAGEREGWCRALWPVGDG